MVSIQIARVQVEIVYSGIVDEIEMEFYSLYQGQL